MGQMLRFATLGLLLSLLGDALAPAHAATVAYLSDAELARRSSRIVHGRVADVWTEVDARGLVRTIARIDVSEDLTGVDAAFVEVEQLGGATASRTMVVPGEPRLEAGTEVVACLEPSRRSGRWRLVALGASLFEIDGRGLDASATGRARLRRRDAGLHVLGRPPAAGEAPTLDEFRRLVRTVRGVRAVRPRRAGERAADVAPLSAPIAAPGVVSANFTLLGGGVRWNEMDAGSTIAWYRNPSAPAPVDGSDGEAEIRTALTAWAAAPGAAVRLAYGGSRAVGTDSVWCGPSNRGAGLITFEDPTNELASGIIALGGGCTTAVGRKTVNGTVFDSFTHGFVILNRSVEVGPAYRTPLNFARIVEHELGHGIGLGHTPTGSAGAQANIMYPSCCYASTPVPPALGVDDLAGVRFIYPAPVTPGDADGDGLPDDWEARWGLDPTSAAGDAGAGGDPDGDGRTNLQEYQEGGHPRGFHRYWFAEGAHSPFFFPELSVFAPGQEPARVLLRTIASPDSDSCAVGWLLAPRRPERWTPAACADMNWASRSASMSIAFESDEALVIERMLSWPYDLSGGALGGLPGATRAAYGAHAEAAVEAPSRTWHFAEGATHSDFDLFFLVFNTEDRAVTVTATFLRPAPLAPVVRTYAVEARTRRTLWVDVEEPDLASTDVAASFAADGAIVVERSMYGSTPGVTFQAGHGAAGARAPATRWWFAEGATGPFFDTFLLVSNPGTDDAALSARFYLSDGTIVERPLVVSAASRVTVWVDALDETLAEAEFGVELVADNGVPVVAERAMWWPGPTPAAWVEAHVAGGLPDLAQRWVTAGGEAGGERGARTYLLVLNPNPVPVDLELTIAFEDGSQVVSAMAAPGTARVTVDVAASVPAVLGRRFAAEVRVLTPEVAGVVVERATYWDSVGGPWAAGVAVRATPR